MCYNKSIMATQNALFPMKYLNVSQLWGSNTFSHRGGYPIDLVGSGSGIDPVYAPFDGIVKKIYGYANETWLESLQPVKFADGKVDYATCLFVHANDVSNLRVGQKIKQGQVFYHEGSKGFVTAPHLHLECARGKFTGSGWHVQSGMWRINNPIQPQTLLSLNANTISINSGGLKWKRVSQTAGGQSMEKIANKGDVVNAYRWVLMREPDQTGLRFHTGKPLWRVYYSLAKSPEHQAQIAKYKSQDKLIKEQAKQIEDLKKAINEDKINDKKLIDQINQQSLDILSQQNQIKELDSIIGRDKDYHVAQDEQRKTFVDALMEFFKIKS